MLREEHAWLSLFCEDLYIHTKCILVHKRFSPFKKVTPWQKSMFVYSIFCIECNCLQPLNELDR